MYTNQQEHRVYFYHPNYTYFFFFILPRKKVPNTFYFFISKGILDQISIALCFIME